MLHSIGFAPQGAFNFLEGTWEDVATAMHVSAYSLSPWPWPRLPLMAAGGSVVGLTFDAKFAWPVYDWMGVAKAAFESTNRYLRPRPRAQGHPLQPGLGRPDPHHGGQVDPGVRASSRRPGTSGPRSAGTSTTRCPPRKACVALLSDWFPATTGEIVHVDGGVHAMGQ